jgi:hypothetical protein
MKRGAKLSSRRSTQGERVENASGRANGRTGALPEIVKPVDFTPKRLAKRWSGRGQQAAGARPPLGEGRLLRPETVAAQAGGVLDAGTGGIVPPIHVATRTISTGAASPCPSDLLRFSVGLEHIDDLIADIEQALDGV